MSHNQVGYISVFLESLYNNASGPEEKKCIQDEDEIYSCQLPEPFCKLKVKRTKGSSGKCWVFHKNREVF